ncbi:MAG: response regulator [Deltaproteobacteria bacterium]|nr:response regulator [Deltaproteobacteria bacterium]
MDPFDKLKDMKILLIDDDEWIRDSLSIYFESRGCNLKALETAVITDYRLPGMDGLEFLKRIQDSHPNAMKILITAYRSEDVVSKAIRIGINDFIDKPFTIKTIEDSLSRLIENRERNTSLMSSIEKNDRRDLDIKKEE